MPHVIAFDVNETLLKLQALDPLFERVFGDAAMRQLWFGQMLQRSDDGGKTWETNWMNTFERMEE